MSGANVHIGCNQNPFWLISHRWISQRMTIMFVFFFPIFYNIIHEQLIFSDSMAQWELKNMNINKIKIDFFLWNKVFWMLLDPLLTLIVCTHALEIKQLNSVFWIKKKGFINYLLLLYSLSYTDTDHIVFQLNVEIEI